MSITKQRYVVFFILFAVLVIADFFIMPAGDSYAAKGKGYRHGNTVLDTTDPYYQTLRGPGRVIFNFRNFLHWWTACPSGVGMSPIKILESDGNSIVQNVIGHFVLSFILSLIAVLLVPRPILICLLGTFMNIFHEYVSEGQYVDPSFVDLWLDQLGLFFAIILFLCIQWCRREYIGENT